MGLRLILGRAGSGKSHLCLKEIADELKACPRGSPLIYIVPEQATFQAEYALTTFPGLDGSIRAQVLSFRRLAWRVMQETGGGKRVFIDDTGKSMLLRRLLEKHKRVLKVFKPAAADTPGSLKNLVNLYNELKRSRISPLELDKVLKKMKEEKESKKRSFPPLFTDKLGDLVLIMKELERELEKHYLDAEDYLTLLAANASRSSLLRDARIWVDGFYGFTNQEYAVLEELMKSCRQVNVTVCAERDYPLEEKADEADPFYPAAVICQRLKLIAGKWELPVECLLLKEQSRFVGNPALLHLEKNLFHHRAEAFSAGGKKLPLKLVAATNRRYEIEALAREILSLVRERDFRFKEMAVIAANLEEYRETISAVFGDYGIPFFMDQERSVLSHPLIEFVRSALEVVNRNWRYEDLFRCVKTEFLLPLSRKEGKRRKWRERVDRLENYVLALGLKGESWLTEKPWEYRLRDTFEEDKAPGLSPAEKFSLRLLNATRNVIRAPLILFQENLRSSSTVREKVAALLHLLKDVRAKERLEGWIKEASLKAQAEKAREHAQVYEGLLGLLEQLVEILGEEEITDTLFYKILEAGMESLRLSLVPPSLDQVLVGNVERTRPGKVKFAFLVGVNEGVLPPRSLEEGIFSDEERQALMDLGMDIYPGSRRRLLEEQFSLYMALTRPSCSLWISYPLADEEGRALLPSLLVARLKELFPELEEKVAGREPVTPAFLKDASGREEGKEAKPERDTEGLTSYLVHPRRTLSYLAVQLGAWKKGASLDPFWWEVYNWYASHEALRGAAARLLAGLFYRNTEKPLSKDTSLALYRDSFKASVSRMERYRACPFAHFVAYGLRLRERQEYRLDTPQVGRFFHAALRNIALRLERQKIDWGELDRDKSQRLAEEEVESLAPRLQQEILFSSSRYRYLVEKLKDTVAKTLYYLGEHARWGKFRPVGVEVSFGEEGLLPAATISLPSGGSIQLVGRIDRVDLARDERGRAFVRVIDYKSGSFDLSLQEVYYGLSLQVVIYLDVVLSNSQQWLGTEAIPAGVFYFRVYAPLIQTNTILSPEEIERERLKRYKMKGKVLGDPEAIRLMDGGLEKGYSLLIPAGITQSGELSKNSSILTKEEFRLLCEHARRIVAETAEEILGGKVEISPYRLGRKKACSYCSYKAVCQFDPLLEGNRFRLLQGGREEEVIKRLRADSSEREVFLDE